MLANVRAHGYRVEHEVDLCRLRAALDQLSEEERSLIYARFFGERSEREREEMMGIHRMTIHNRKIRILQKLKKMLR